jgi:hypothetical protein
MSDYTKVNLKDVEDSAPKFNMPPGMQARFARSAIEGETLGLSGSASIKVEDDIVELQQWDAIRLGPDTMRNMQAGPEGAEYIAFGAGTDPRDAEMTPGWWTE